jgi:hypothetical protein
MALSTITFTIQDAKSAKSRLQVIVEHPEFIDDAREDPADYASAFAQLLDPLITGKIVDIGVTRSVALPSGIKTVAAQESDVEDGAIFLWRTEADSTVSMRVATFDEQYYVPRSRKVDVSTPLPAPLSDWLIHITSPGEGPGDYLLTPCDNRGAEIRDLKDAYEQFVTRKRR